MKRDRLTGFASWVLFLMLFGGPLSGTAPQQDASRSLDALLHPVMVAVHRDSLVVYDNGDDRIKSYGLADLCRRADIGAPGDGPGEYSAVDSIFADDRGILVSAPNKILRFDFEGKLQEEKRITTRLSGLVSLGEHYLGNHVDFSGEQFVVQYLICDERTRPVTVVHEGPWIINKKTRKRNYFEVYFYGVFRGTWVVADRVEPKIRFFSEQGDARGELAFPAQNLPFTEADRRRVQDYFEHSPGDAAAKRGIAPKLEYPAVFPEILTCCVDRETLYVITYQRQEGRGHKTLVSRSGHQPTRAVYVPLQYDVPIPMFINPFFITNHCLYQLVETEDNEAWELKKTPLVERDLQG